MGQIRESDLYCQSLLGLLENWLAAVQFVRLDSQRTAKLFDNHLRYCESEANTILVDIIFELKLLKHLANVGLVLYTQALVPNFNYELLYSIGRLEDFHAQSYLTFHWILHCIRDEIRKNLRNSIEILLYYVLIVNCREVA